MREQLRIESVGSYRNANLRGLAIGIKENDMRAILKSAELMSGLVKENAVLIPIPSKRGYATNTLKLANLIAKKTGAEVCNILKGKNRQSFCELKRQGVRIVDSEFFGFYLTGDIPEGKRIYLVDNVTATGQTAKNAVDLIPGNIVSVLVLAD
jgi:predicted amidophosphoribosyltransferase